MKKIFILTLGIILLTNSVFSQGIVRKRDSIESKKLDFIKSNLENSKKFLNILDSNKEAKDEYLLGLHHYEKARKELGKAFIGIGAFAILSSVSLSQENEGLGIASVGGLGMALFYDINSIIHSVKAIKHFKKSYKIAGVNPPNFGIYKKDKIKKQ